MEMSSGVGVPLKSLPKKTLTVYQMVMDDKRLAIQLEDDSVIFTMTSDLSEEHEKPFYKTGI